MAKVAFRVDTENRLFSFLGLGAGVIIADGEEVDVLSCDLGMAILEEVLGKDDYVPDHPDVLRIAEEMRAANLAVNLPDLFTKIGAVAKPEHIYTNGFAFLPCRPTCRLGIPHGHIYFLDVLLGQVTNLVQGLAILNVLVRKRYSDVMTNGVMTPEIAVFLVQKMLEINMMRSGVEVDEYLTKTSPLYVQAKRQKELLDALAESKEEIRRLSL